MVSENVLPAKIDMLLLNGYRYDITRDIYIKSAGASELFVTRYMLEKHPVQILKEIIDSMENGPASSGKTILSIPLKVTQSHK